MANLDTAAKRAAGIATAGLALVLPIPDGSNADSILQRAHLVAIYGANTSQSDPLSITGRVRVTQGHEYRVREGHRHRVTEGHTYRVRELA